MKYSVLIGSVITMTSVFGNMTNYVQLPFNLSIFPGISIGEKIGKGKKIREYAAIHLLAGRGTNLNGMAIGTIWNHYSEEVMGIQLGGVGNSSSGYLRGLQFAGLTNYSGGRAKGVQIAGLFNLGRGFFQGAQLSCFVNYASKRFKGIQISPFLNIANQVDHGWQIGAINFSNKNNGRPIGLISYVKSYGLHAEVWGDELGFINFGVHSGVRVFHNLLFAGFQPGQTGYFTVGWGLGSRIYADAVNFTEIEASIQYLQERDTWEEHINYIGKFRMLGGFQMAKYSSIYFGPSLNIQLANKGIQTDAWAQWIYRPDEYQVVLWPGFVAGLRF